MKPFIRKELIINKYIDALRGNTVEIETTVFLFGVPVIKLLRLIIHQS